MRHPLLFLILLVIAPLTSSSQNVISFQEISFPLDAAWSEVGDISVNPESGKAETMKGSGILLNLPGKRQKGVDIYSREEYGNFDLSFYYMMFPGSNSGVYLHGNYEVQLLDSWGVKIPTSADNGGIYERWTDEGKGYQGKAPRQNASRAPGIWQHMEISFTAPQFDEDGNKIENARISVRLNGVPVHTDVELTGPTRGARSEERPRGPVRIQGDHGPVAFRDMKVVAYDSPEPELSNLSYEVYKGQFEDRPDFSSLTPVGSGSLDVMTPEVSAVRNEFLIRYKGTLTVRTDGMYAFEADFPGGGGYLDIDGNQVIGISAWEGEGSVRLEAGEYPVEVGYSKVYDWVRAGLSVRVKGPGFRMIELADPTVNVAGVVDPIYLDAPNVLRSFMDIPDEGRVVRAVSVGTSENVHYTYDMDNGSIVHLWRGEFLNTTPMWHSRGDGSSEPRGSICYLDGTAPPVQPMTSQWKADTTGLQFRIKGYRTMKGEAMTFLYSIGNYQIEDLVQPMSSGKGISRTLTSGSGSPLYVRLGHGEKINEVDKGLFRVLGRGTYYVRIDSSAEAEVRRLRRVTGGRKS